MRRNCQVPKSRLRDGTYILSENPPFFCGGLVNHGKTMGKLLGFICLNQTTPGRPTLGGWVKHNAHVNANMASSGSNFGWSLPSLARTLQKMAKDGQWVEPSGGEKKTVERRDWQIYVEIPGCVGTCVYNMAMRLTWRFLQEWFTNALGVSQSHNTTEITLPKTNIAPENWWLENELFFWGWPIFRGYVCFRVCSFLGSSPPVFSMNLHFSHCHWAGWGMQWISAIKTSPKSTKIIRNQRHSTDKTVDFSMKLLLMEEILHQLSDRYFIPLFAGFYTSQVVVWDFFHQQYG